jgi:S-adenosylmethionine/arginine decarboxylase-like enzyme
VQFRTVFISVFTEGVRMIYNGLHLMIDATLRSEDGGTPHEWQRKALLDSQIGERTLSNIVERIDMTMILPPISVSFPHAVSEMDKVLKALEEEGLADSVTAKTIRHNLKTRVEQTCGYSSFLMIAESHITLHSFPNSDFFTFDCYSCKCFDEQAVISTLKESFGGGAWVVQSVSRTVPQVK